MTPPGTPEIPPWAPVLLRMQTNIDTMESSQFCCKLVTQGVPIWSALFIEPWLAAIERAETASALWLGETSSAMSECMHDWWIRNPSIDDAIDAALNASQVLSAALQMKQPSNIDEARRQACTSMSALINAARHAKPREMRFEA